MFLVDATIVNRAVLCKFGLTLVIIDQFESALKVRGGRARAGRSLAAAPLGQDANSPVQPQLLNILSQLCRHRMAKLELRCLLRLLRVRAAPAGAGLSV